MLGVFFGQSCAAYDLHLMYLQHVDGQRGDDRCLLQTFFTVFSGESEYDMGARKYAPCMRSFYGRARTGKVVPAVERSSVRSLVVSMPYSTNRKVCLFSSSK